ncbi:MAG: ATP-binding protein, partial [Chloroflexi bacterium]|nr:ATP-binding protein [Chloroflexota bacterium]
AELIHLGHLYGATIIGYYFETNVRQSLERNRQRTGKARVPDIAIFATLKKLVRPTYAEGFAQIFHVRTAGDETFEVSNWVDTEI